MGNKTIYINDSDAKIWDEANEWAKETGNLSQFVINSLDREVKRMQKLKDVKEDIQRIVVEITRPKGTKKISFNGKWLLKDYEDRFNLISVAITEKESYFVYFDTQASQNDSYVIYEYFKEFTDAHNIPEEAKSIVSNIVGEEYAEFLDI